MRLVVCVLVALFGATSHSHAQQAKLEKVTKQLDTELLAWEATDQNIRDMASSVPARQFL
jgi:hypothetical protein